MWLFVCRSGPGKPLAVRELVDILVMAAIFGQEVRVLLTGDGIRNLMIGQDSPLWELGDLLSGPVLLDRESIPESLPEAGPPPFRLTPEAPEAIGRLFRDSERVVMF